jgi:hypothetical protein
MPVAGIAMVFIRRYSGIKRYNPVERRDKWH